MKTQLSSFLFTALISFTGATEKPKIIELSEWVSGVQHREATPGQYEQNSEIKFLTIHFTHTESGDGTRKSEEGILNSRVHSSGLYQWEKMKNGDYYISLDENGEPLPNFGGTPYHYLIGKSGNIYKGRPDAIAPASNTFYFTEEMLARASTEFNGSTKITWKDAKWIVDSRRKAFEKWKEDIGSANYLVWEERQQEILRKEGKLDHEGSLLDRAKKKGVRLLGPGNTSGHLTISFIGKHERPSEKALDSAVKLIAHLVKQHATLKLDGIRTHREVANTVCPGAELQMWVRHKNGQKGELFSRLTELK